MENTHNLWEQKILINELTQGRELVQQLRIHLDTWSFSSTGELLITKLLSSFDKSLVMLNWVKLEGAEPQLSGESVVSATKPTRSISESDNDLDLRFKSKKRRLIAPRWTEEVRVCPKTGLEGPLDDAYSWRKYGQKDIIGAKYPKAYYRCTYRNVEECLAIKQVQRSDEDPRIFNVTYRGRHTCTQASLVIPGQSPNKQNEDQKQKISQEFFINFQTGSEAKREDLNTKEFTSASFISSPSTSVPISCFEKENHIFISSSTPDNHFMGSFAPPSISPITSQSNYLCPYGMNNFSAQTLQTSDSYLNEIVSAANSTSNLPILDLDLDFAVDFDSHFSFDIPGFFS